MKKLIGVWALLSLGVAGLSGMAWSASAPVLRGGADPKAEWVDGESIRSYIESMIPEANEDTAAGIGISREAMAPFLDQLEGAWLHNDADSLRIEVLLKAPVKLNFRKLEQSKMGQLYALAVPKYFEFEIRGKDGRIQISKLESLTFSAKIPGVSDAIRISRVSADLSTGNIEIRARAVWGLIPLVARVQVFAKMKTGVDWKATLTANLLQAFPWLRLFVKTGQESVTFVPASAQ